MQTVETLNEGLKRAYTLTISAKDLEAWVDREVQNIAPQVRMPGFRPGKVPANLVKKMHGEALQRDALNSSIQSGVQQVIADNKLRPAMQPSVELNEDFEFGKDAEVKVELEILPDLPAPSIDGLTLERLTVEATEAEIDQAAGRIAEQSQAYAAYPEGTEAKDGDVVVLDYVGKVDGEPFEGGTGEAMKVGIGSGRLIPGFEDQLVGVKAGDEKTINVTFPADYPAKELEGKAATFDLKILSVLDPSKPQLDDDFAKGLGLESYDKLKELLKGQVEQELNGLTRTHMKRKLLDQLAAAHSFDVPPTMVDAEFQQIWQQLEHEASHEEDPEAAIAEMEKEKDDYRGIAERRVRLGLLLSEIGQANGVEVSQQEMNMLVQQAAMQYGPQDRQRFIEYIQREPMAAAQLRAPLYEDKVVDFLFDKAEITDKPVTRAELEAAIEDDDTHVHGPGCGHDHDHDHDHAPAPKAKKAASKKVAAAKAEDEAEAAPAEEKPAAKKAAAPKKAVAEKAEKPAAADKPAKAEKAEKPAAAKKPAAKKAKAD